MRVGASCREGAHAAAIVGGGAFLFPLFFIFFYPSLSRWASDFPLFHGGWGTDRGVVEGGGGEGGRGGQSRGVMRGVVRRRKGGGRSE